MEADTAATDQIEGGVTTSQYLDCASILMLFFAW